MLNKALGFERPKLHSCQLNGGQCAKLLDNIKTFENILKTDLDQIPDKLRNLVSAM